MRNSSPIERENTAVYSDRQPQSKLPSLARKPVSVRKIASAMATALIAAKIP